MHAPMACAPDASSYAVFQELGDFEPATPTTGYVVGDVGAVLPEIDNAAKALLVKATQNTSQSQSSSEWLGLGDVPSTGNVDVLLLPSLASCAFTTPVGARTQSKLGAIGGQRVLVVGGKGASDGGASSPSTYVVHLDTGEVAPVTTDTDLLMPRTQGTVTPFGDGGLVAGGFDSTGTPLAEAEVYDPDVGGFLQQSPILLSQPRAQHGAAVLITGETLLVGGVGAGQTVLDTMEIVDPVTRTVRAENIATLAVARKSPTVLQLASGEIFVAGGVDGDNNPITKIEWFKSDASQASKVAQDLVAGSARAYAPLEAGGVLAVIVPPAGAEDFLDVWVIGADGFPSPAATALAGLQGQPVLFGGAGGAPVLFVPASAPASPDADADAGTGDSSASATPARWLRWQPYVGEFGVLGVDIAANVGDATASPDPGLAMWLDPTNPNAVAVAALRFDAIDDYSTLEGPLFVADTNDTAPDQLVSAGGITFDPALGLTLGSNASAFVTDRTYADFTVDVDAPTGQPAILVLRDEGPDEAALLGTELDVGGTSCPAALSAQSSAPSSLHVERTGASVVWSVAGGASGTCPNAFGQTARLSIGVRAPTSVGSVVRNLRVTRMGTP